MFSSMFFPGGLDNERTERIDWPTAAVKEKRIGIGEGTPGSEIGKSKNKKKIRKSKGMVGMGKAKGQGKQRRKAPRSASLATLATLAMLALGGKAQAGLVDLDDLAKRVAGMGEKAMAEEANRWANGRLAYKSDKENWGLEDRWATPLEARGEGAGDCEDYALLKYAALRRVGVPESRLRLVVGRAKIQGLVWSRWESHAMLAYWPEGAPEPLLLDNMIPEAKPASERSDFAAQLELGEWSMGTLAEEGRRGWEARPPGYGGAIVGSRAAIESGGGILFPHWALWLARSRLEGALESDRSLEDLAFEENAVLEMVGDGLGKGLRGSASGAPSPADR